MTKKKRTRKRGLPANYNGATPEQVAASLFRRPMRQLNDEAEIVRSVPPKQDVSPVKD